MTEPGESIQMPTREQKRRNFTIADKPLEVAWTSVDFTKDPDYAGTPARYIQFGVQFMPATESSPPEIRTSSQISDSNQGLSALHERLCMQDRVAACAEVEALVVESIGSPEERQDYVGFRRGMFAVLVEDNPAVEAFAASLNYLNSVQ